MVDVFTEIVIDRPVAETATYAANPDNAPEWYTNIKTAEWKTQKTLEPGAQIAFNAHFLGRELAYVYEIIEFIPEQKMVMKTADGPFPMETVYTWHALENGQTRMTLRNKGIPSGFSKVAAPFMSAMMKRANTKDLKKIKEILETGPAQLAGN